MSGQSHPNDCNPCGTSLCPPCTTAVGIPVYVDLSQLLDSLHRTWYFGLSGGVTVDVSNVPLYPWYWSNNSVPANGCNLGANIYGRCADQAWAPDVESVVLEFVTDSVGHPGEHKWKLTVSQGFITPNPYYATYETSWTSDTDCASEADNMTLSLTHDGRLKLSCPDGGEGDTPPDINVNGGKDYTSCPEEIYVTLNGTTYAVTRTVDGYPTTCQYALYWTDGNGCNGYIVVTLSQAIDPTKYDVTVTSSIPVDALCGYCEFISGYGATPWQGTLRDLARGATLANDSPSMVPPCNAYTLGLVRGIWPI